MHLFVEVFMSSRMPDINVLLIYLLAAHIRNKSYYILPKTYVVGLWYIILSYRFKIS